MKTMKDKITICHWCFQFISISVKMYFKKFFSNFICFAINHDFIKIFFNIQCSISITVTFMFNIVVNPKITYSYWFIIIFFFMLKKVPNISNYSIVSCFILFFQSEKIFYIFNCGVMYFFFQSKNISCFDCSALYFFFLFFFFFFFYIFNNVAFYFLSFSCLETLITICCEKIND